MHSSGTAMLRTCLTDQKILKTINGVNTDANKGKGNGIIESIRFKTLPNSCINSIVNQDFFDWRSTCLSALDQQVQFLNRIHQAPPQHTQCILQFSCRVLPHIIGVMVVEYEHSCCYSPPRQLMTTEMVPRFLSQHHHRSMLIIERHLQLQHHLSFLLCTATMQ